MDCSAAVAALLYHAQDLPTDLVDTLQFAPNDVFLTQIAESALHPRYGSKIYLYLRPVYTEICGRWLEAEYNFASTVATFGRILESSPHLAAFADKYLAQTTYGGGLLRDSSSDRDLWQQYTEDELVTLLLGFFRLLVFDNETFSRHLNAAVLSEGLSHTSKVVRYLTIRIMCILLHAADAAMEGMLERYIGQELDDLDGPWDEKTIDYRFLCLWEEQRQKWLHENLSTALQVMKGVQPNVSRKFQQSDFLPTTALIAGLLVPRLPALSGRHAQEVDLVPTSNTVLNLRNIAEGLLLSEPLLLSGQAGAGKTSLVSALARQLDKFDGMVTLHVNEQSDAKLLVGLYTSGAKPGTFVWKPGVLTTAVREGRWVFIEDLDRAPNDIISTLLPLIENKQLLIPGRGEVVRAAPGFKLIATMRTVPDLKGNHRLANPHILGLRFWRQIYIHMPIDQELAEIVKSKHPAVTPLIGQLTEIYAKIRTLSETSFFRAQVKSGTARGITTRDFLKWCQRISNSAASYTFSESQLDDIFLEAIDCFAGYLPFGEAFLMLAEVIAKKLHIDPSRRDHLLQNREIRLLSSQKSSKTLQIGRACIHYSYFSRSKRLSQRPFAKNRHTLHLLESVGVAVQNREPLLLVGETGTGKTTSIQYLADELGQRLVAFNMSQQSESSDLLGGFKPVNMRTLILPLKDEFEDLFQHTFSRKGNQAYIEKLGKLFAKGKWKSVCDLWKAALAQVEDYIGDEQPSSPVRSENDAHPKKRQKIVDGGAGGNKRLSPAYRERWKNFKHGVKDLEAQLASKSNAFAFAFMEGALVKAVRNGDWLLLDEINLASPDTLEALVDLLHDGTSGQPSLLLTESGNLEHVKAHPTFRVFAAMNPATDIGKKDLPAGIRSRFTELYVDSLDRDVKSLQSVIESYLGENLLDRRLVADIAELYQKVQSLTAAHSLIDGAGQVPHFSLRTLTRTLVFTRDMAQFYGMRRAVYEGFLMSFSTLLDKTSESLLSPLIAQHIFGQRQNMYAELRRPIQKPVDQYEYVGENSCWLRRGRFEVEEQPHYIITPFVRKNLDNLIRAISSRRYPILLQGPTSSGKTSMIQYLAKKSGNKFVRINNHEHTDLQEYLGTYVSDADGKLRFQEGILVDALRKGYWIVLDELNLAPTDVLEALNRLLDDNRELLIPETQEIVRPHPDFILFATQNPAGLYGGRKHLSRAFRNRFLELHFDDIPVDELCDILHRRTQIPESWARRIVDAYRELSTLRQESRLFEQKSFATLRDLFRWALRKADTVEELALNGYMLLAERVRKENERVKIKQIIEDVMSRRGPRIHVDEGLLYSQGGPLEMQLHNSSASDSPVTWTRSMRRLYTLVSYALRNNEPVLLVGETGCGKTSVCQMLATSMGKQLFIINAHQNTETGDIIGSQRPIRNRAATEAQLRELLLQALQECSVDVTEADTNTLLRSFLSLNGESFKTPSQFREQIDILRIRMSALFEWHDGGLVEAMKGGQLFLLDEISLADDSVLERLNSVLEPERTILLAEKGTFDSQVTAEQGFQFLATMNPGGDYGKRELSPALRNRFTEIWVPPISDANDILQIVQTRLKRSVVFAAPVMVEFAQWFTQTYNTSATSSMSIRDSLAWVDFVNTFGEDEHVLALLHGAAMVFIDALGANPAAILSISAATAAAERQKCIRKLGELLQTDLDEAYNMDPVIAIDKGTVTIGQFSIPRGESSGYDATFSFTAPTTRVNAMRIFRALQLIKPILIEGNPGVGKTTLVAAIANLVGKPLVRINLSEQTDLMDLFGSDVPVEGAKAGVFAWRDAPFLSAMKSGHWVLLDEMNLASQSVLEGLNACLDHRGEAYISELNQTFSRHPNFRIFAAQNPHHQGGGRKGLPASFVNRFTVVYADVFKPEDLMPICKQIFPRVTDEQISALINFVDHLNEGVVVQRRFGSIGNPWEFNLRDTLRWLQLATSQEGLLRYAISYDLCDIIFRQRFRSNADRDTVDKLFSKVFGIEAGSRSFYHNINTNSYQVGLGQLRRSQLLALVAVKYHVQQKRLATFEALMLCVQQSWPVALVGTSGSGKTCLLQQLAAAAGQKLVTFSMNADIDAMDLVGGFEQADVLRKQLPFVTKLRNFVLGQIVTRIEQGDAGQCQAQFKVLERLRVSHLPKSSLKACREYLQQLVDTGAQVEDLLSHCDAVLSQPEAIEQAQFEWVDGLLVQALETGSWLVLDNANLCSSSVLDRLNSLLEPGGYLTINEHPTESGAPRIVKPHADFRIFLTMDPCYGELSRAMRNRAVELFLMPPDQEDGDVVHPSSFAFEAAMYRFRNFLKTAPPPEELSQQQSSITYDHLSFDDLSIHARFLKEVRRGLVSELQAKHLQYSPDIHGDVGSILRSWRTEVVRRLELLIPPSDNMLQSIHPLNNEVVSRRSPQPFGTARKLANCYESAIEIAAMRAAWSQAAREARSRQPVSLFDKSVLAAVLKRENSSADSTIRIAEFLKASLDVLIHALGTAYSQDYSHESIFAALSDAREYWWNLFRLAKGSGFEHSIFEVLLRLWRTAIASIQQVEGLAVCEQITQLLNTYFVEHRSLTGGMMDALWQCLKPPTARTMDRLGDLLQLESLADRFDNLTFQSEAPLEKLAQLRQSFQAAISASVIENIETKDLAKELEGALQGLATLHTPATEPFFKHQFDAAYVTLSAKHLLASQEAQEAAASTLSMLSLLARRPTKLVAFHLPNLEAATILQRLVHVSVGAGISVEALQSTAVESTLDKIQSVDEVALSDLDLIQSELQVLGRTVAMFSPQLCHNVTGDLKLAFERICSGLSRLSVDGLRHDEHCDQVLEESKAIIRDYLLGSFGTHYLDRNAASRAWTALAVFLIRSYVPSRPYDPALRISIERRMYLQRLNELQTSVLAQKNFERQFSGQSSNLRLRLLERKLEGAGDPPEAAEVARPEISELNQLQPIFNNVLQISDSFQAGWEAPSHGEYLNIKSNLDQTIRRLSQNFEAYRDITAPVVSFLQCLSVGLALSQTGQRDSDASRGNDEILSALLLLRNQQVPETRDPSTHAVLQQLRLAAIAANIKTPDFRMQQQIREWLAFIYGQWRSHLKSEQEKNMQKSSLYVFRGSFEEDEVGVEEAFSELFPDYAAEKTRMTPDEGMKSSRQVAIETCELHYSIVYPNGGAESLSSTTLEKTIRIASSPAKAEAALIPALLMIRERIDIFQGKSETARHYNIYTNPNLQEAKAVSTIVRRAQQRFEEIKQIWPDHATLHEVIRICEEILAFRHTEPVVKFLTKLEKLQEAVHEWQKVASREYSAINVYNDINELIVHWRRLELSTWARLLDLEVEKVTDDAKSWWFIAYENIIAIPETLLAEGQPLQEHAKELLNTLETFIKETPAGQYQERIKLLHQFQTDLGKRTEVVPEFATLRAALINFINFYSRFEPKIEAYLLKHRQQFEREIKEVVQLASWKDTTIEALRQSAKTSHRKLFKVVRKFRRVLGQPVTALIEQGFPERTTQVALCQNLNLPSVSREVDPTLLRVCETILSDWDKVPSRFKNVGATTGLMHKLASSQSAFQGALYIEDFVTTLKSSIKSLQQSTPTCVTDENMATLKQLKVQKRILFAETLRTLRKMGLQHNLSSTVLSGQDSLIKVLARLKSQNSRKEYLIFKSAEDDFHMSLYLIDQARSIQREHHGDLTPAEVTRSIGFLEALLSRNVAQRQLICSLLDDVEHLRTTLGSIAACRPTKTYILSRDGGTFVVLEKLRSDVSWLLVILGFFAKVITIQSSLGDLDASDIIREIEFRKTDFLSLFHKISALPATPASVSTSLHHAVIEEGRVLMSLFEESLSGWITNNASFAPVLRQLQPWMIKQVNAMNGISRPSNHLEDFGYELFASIDSILSSIQDLESATASSPSSEEETAWFIKEETCITTCIRALRVADINKALAKQLQALSTLSDDDIQGAANLLGHTYPILQQFEAIVNLMSQRLLNLYAATCKLHSQLCSSFIIIGTKGFCHPSEKSNDSEAQPDKLEGGTGLGEGEGAEDISKDIAAGEDLTELAEEHDKNEKQDTIEDEKDAVDMADADMAGQMGEMPDEEDDEASVNSSDKGEGDDMDEEAGDVDDQGPSAVDEKMWDNGEKVDKDKEGDQAKGQKQEDQLAGADNKGQENREEENEEAEEGAEESENITQEQPEKLDQHVQESDTLSLPDDINLEDNERQQSDIDSDEGLVNETEVEEADQVDEHASIPEDLSSENAEKDNLASEDEITEEPMENTEADHEAGSGIDEETEIGHKQDQENFMAAQEEHATAAEDAMESENQGVGLKGQQDQQNISSSANAAIREDGNSAEDRPDEAGGGKDSASKEVDQGTAGRHEEQNVVTTNESFKKLGDALERWYRQHREIRSAGEEQRKEPSEGDDDMADADFEHLPDNQTNADTQALGTAAQEQAVALNEELAADVNEQDLAHTFLPEDDEDEPTAQQEMEADMEDIQPDGGTKIQDQPGVPNAFIGEHNPKAPGGGTSDFEDELSEAELQEVDTHLSAVHLEASDDVLSKESARALWSRHEANTRMLAATLTEHLRLILAPTLATKLRGDFRTGKRLNIKRIIPYIASSYKRDKIWMRRSVPSKRSYQIMIALDDSKSMTEGTTNDLAFETLALVAKALTMLEAGQLCVVKFGQDVRTAHPFDRPFTDEAGADVFATFGFDQQKTDVRKLVSRSIELFQEARAKASGSTVDLWQLMLIISDGVCEDHEGIQRAVRQAQEERIMMVFVVVDAAMNRVHFTGEESKHQSIMDLQTAEFKADDNGDLKLVRHRYMDTFPFKWWIVVRDVRELPGVLATALRQWFAEVADASR